MKTSSVEDTKKKQQSLLWVGGNHLWLLRYGASGDKNSHRILDTNKNYHKEKLKRYRSMYVLWPYFSKHNNHSQFKKRWKPWFYVSLRWIEQNHWHFKALILPRAEDCCVPMLSFKMGEIVKLENVQMFSAALTVRNQNHQEQLKSLECFHRNADLRNIS